MLTNRILAAEPVDNSQKILARASQVIADEAAGLVLLKDLLDENFVRGCNAIASMRRQLVVTGMGKSGHIARKIAATFAATGTSAIFVHPGEAGHGDMGMISAGDVLLVLSNSGNTSELKAILSYAGRNNIPIIGVASQRNSHVIKVADIPILLPRVPEACPVSIAPTTSTTMQLALGDAFAMAVMDIKGIDRRKLRDLHPLGLIGVSLTPLRELMHEGERLPLVSKSAGMPEAISIMTSGCLGLAGVVDADGALVGIITDGDLRRRFGVLDTALAHEVMTHSPKVLSPEVLAADALAFLNEYQITAAFVVEDPSAASKRPIGIVHIHDLLRFGLS